MIPYRNRDQRLDKEEDGTQLSSSKARNYAILTDHV